MSSAMPFSNVTENSGDTHVVYALFNCRNDLPLGTCRGCVEDAAENILDLCHPWPKEAIVIYKECMLRYANRMIFSSMELKPYKQHCGGVKYLVSTSEIKSGVKRKLEAMIDEATNSSDYFAVGHVNDIANHKVYFLVQCTPDLSKEQCNDCLTHSLNFTVQSCASDNRLWGHTMFPSCQMRYDIEPFFNVSSNDLT